jgi:hypothetical protein
MREETVTTTLPASHTAETIRCACDADGNLHVRAPQGGHVYVPEDATQPAEAEVVLDTAPPPPPIRRTVSLGFIGDDRLTELPSYGGPWDVPDGLLPPHEHREGSGVVYGTYGGVVPYVYYGRTVMVPSNAGAGSRTLRRGEGTLLTPGLRGSSRGSRGRGWR